MKITMVLCRPIEALPYDSRVLREAGALVDAGHRVTIVVARAGDTPLHGLMDGRIETIAVPIPDIAGLGKQNIFKEDRSRNKSWLAASKQLLANRVYRHLYYRNTLKVLLNQRADAYHCHDLQTLAVGVRAAKVCDSLIVYDSHEVFTETMAFEGTAGRIKKPLYIWHERRLIRNADRVIAVGESCARFLARRYQIPLPIVVENVSDLPTDTDTARDEIRREMGVSPGNKLIIYQGLLGAGRGIEVLLDAMRHLSPNFFLALLGNGPSTLSLQRRAEALGIEKRVRFVGLVQRARLLAYTRAADVGIIPVEKRCLNYYYALPNKIFEYMAAGIPFAVSDFPDMHRLAIDEDMGVTFDPTDPQSIAEALGSLFSDATTYNRKRENTIKGFTERHNWEIVQKKLLDIYSGNDIAAGDSRSVT